MKKDYKWVCVPLNGWSRAGTVVSVAIFFSLVLSYWVGSAIGGELSIYRCYEIHWGNLDLSIYRWLTSLQGW